MTLDGMCQEKTLDNYADIRYHSKSKCLGYGYGSLSKNGKNISTNFII